jgi:hypothetical protein
MTLWQVAILLLFALLLLALGMLQAQRRRLAQMADELARVQGQQRLQAQSISGLTAGSKGVDRRLARLEAQEQVLSQRQDTFESQQADERPYHRAIQLVQQGAGVRRLVEELELSESEADLIVRLHGAADAAASVQV